MVRRLLKTRLLNGHDTNCRLGSRSRTSIDGSPKRTYLAAVAPPHPPPITTTRRPGFGSTSPVPDAHPAPPIPTPRATPDILRNSLRVTCITAPPGMYRTAPRRTEHDSARADRR